MLVAASRLLKAGTCWRCFGPWDLGFASLRRPWLTASYAGQLWPWRTSSCVPSSLLGSPTSRRLWPRQHGSAALQSLFTGVANHRRPTRLWFSLPPILLVCLKALPFARSSARVFGDGAILQGRVPPIPFRHGGSDQRRLPHSTPDTAAMGLLSLRLGRNPCSACRCG